MGLGEFITPNQVKVRDYSKKLNKFKININIFY